MGKAYNQLKSSLRKLLLLNQKIFFVICIYSVLTFLILSWGLPNEGHPYTYHMDEWHQLHSVKAVFKYGTPNVEKAAYGPLFHFFLSGIFLLPFMALGIINPFLVKSDFSALAMQARIFEILRLNTLIFGILSILVLAKIVKDYLKINPLVTVIFFTFTPIWLSLSNYFKYDIALVFWILLSLLFLLRYQKRPIFRLYLLAAIPCGLALSTKISSLPIVLIYIYAYFLFTPKKQWKLINLFKGIGALLGIFLLAGVPYLFYTKAGFKDFFFYNLIINPKESANYILGMNYWVFLFFRQYPAMFGKVFYWLFIVALFFLAIVKKNEVTGKSFRFILFSFIVFFLSLVPLKLFVFNRGLVLLPFMAIIIGLFVERASDILPRRFKKIFIFILTIAIVYQSLESFSWVLPKFEKDPRQVSSAWLAENIPPGTTIGVEEVVIYQEPPDIILKEYCLKESGVNVNNRFYYQLVNGSTKDLAPVVVVTNRLLAEKQKRSGKKDLIVRLNKEGYIIVAEFKPNLWLYSKFNDDINFYIPNLVPSPMITVYRKEFAFAGLPR